MILILAIIGLAIILLTAKDLLQKKYTLQDILQGQLLWIRK